MDQSEKLRAKHFFVLFLFLRDNRDAAPLTVAASPCSLGLKRIFGGGFSLLKRPRTNLGAFSLGKRDTAKGRASVKRKALMKIIRPFCFIEEAPKK